MYQLCVDDFGDDFMITIMINKAVINEKNGTGDAVVMDKSILLHWFLSSI